MDWWERGLMPEDRRRINRSQSRSNRLSSTASACRSLIFIAAPSCGDAEPLPFRPEPSPLHHLCGNGGHSSVDVQCLRFARARLKKLRVLAHFLQERGRKRGRILRSYLQSLFDEQLSPGADLRSSSHRPQTGGPCRSRSRSLASDKLP